VGQEGAGGQDRKAGQEGRAGGQGRKAGQEGGTNNV